MKKTYCYLTLLCTVICLTACNKDDNGNDTDISTDKPVSLIGNEAKAYQQRMEVPAVKDQSMLIVHCTTKYSVTYTEEWDKELRAQRWAAYTITDMNAVTVTIGGGQPGRGLTGTETRSRRTLSSRTCIARTRATITTTASTADIS